MELHEYHSHYTALVTEVYSDWSIKVSSALFEGDFTIKVKPITAVYSKNTIIQALPSKGDKVYLIFQDGDLRFPFYLPCTDEIQLKLPLDDFFIKHKKSGLLHFGDKLKLIQSDNMGIVIDSSVFIGNTSLPYQPTVLADSLNAHLNNIVTNISNIGQNLGILIDTLNVLNAANTAALPVLGAGATVFTTSALAISATLATISNNLVLIAQDLPNHNTQNIKVN